MRHRAGGLGEAEFTVFVVAGQQALPLVHGQTIKVEASELDRSWGRSPGHR